MRIPPVMYTLAWFASSVFFMFMSYAIVFILHDLVALLLLPLFIGGAGVSIFGIIMSIIPFFEFKWAD